jgi:hypothetical protein
MELASMSKAHVVRPIALGLNLAGPMELGLWGWLLGVGFIGLRPML